MVNQLSDPRKGANPKSMLDVRHLTKTYGSLMVVKDINFAIPSGSSCTIVGASGSV
jgi:ABC-type Fe3+/spermidine/putrescine transport system ATPase subunit